MNRVSVLLLIISVSISLGQIGYQPIAGELLEHWKTANSCFEQLPHPEHEGIVQPSAVPAHSVTVNILSEELLPIETVNLNPVRIDSFQPLESGGLSVFASRTLYTFGVNYSTASWTICIGSDGHSLSIEETVPYHRFILTLSAPGERYGIWLIACTAQGDTVWTCALEDTDEFYESPDVAELRDGGYTLSSYSEGYIARISSDGELLWHSYLRTDYMLGIPAFEAENCPRILSVRETSRGDFILCGTVAEYLTSPDGFFVCLLDGDSGEPLWRTVNFALGEAEVCDAIETSSGIIVAVGSTAMSITPEDAPYCTAWGSKFPLIAVLNESGELKEVLVCYLDLTDSFYSIIETDRRESEFLIFGGDSLSNETVLLRAIIPTDPENLGTGSDYQFNLIDSGGNEYQSDEYGIVSRVWAGRSEGPISGMDFVTIPSGSFMMGSPESDEQRYFDEEQHRVHVNSFELLATEVTQGMWREVMGGSDLEQKMTRGEGDDYPMYYVSWNDCQEFIRKLNEMDSRYIYRLPSEAEWEYACRAGTTTRYYWGNELNVYCCWCRENSNSSNHRVGTREPNAWGLYDMSGSVSEWCEDSYTRDYNECPTDGSAYIGSGSGRIFRGGSWYIDSHYHRSANRGYLNPDFSLNDQGFRIVRAVKTPE